MKIKDDLSLLNLMMSDARKQSGIYRPEKYWKNKVKNAVNEIKRCGLSSFRGSNNLSRNTNYYKR